MKKLFEQLDFSALGDPQALDPSTPINRTKTNTGDATTVTVINNKLDMSVLKPFKPVKLSDNRQKVTANNNTYTFYPNGKVWDNKLKKHVTWSTKNGKVFVAGFELKQSSADGEKYTNAETKAEAVKLQKQAIRNSIIFYETMSKLTNTFNWDEVTIYKVMAKYITPVNAPYIDALIRMISGDMKDLRKKYLPAYNYWLSRNSESGTTFQYLASLPFDYLTDHALTDIISREFADYLDLDSTDPKIVKLKKQLQPVFPNIINHTKSRRATYTETKLNGRMSKEQIHKMVMDIYNTKAFGSIKKIK